MLYVTDFFDSLNLNSNCWIAGGAALSAFLNKPLTIEQDVDIFFRSDNHCKNYIEDNVIDFTITRSTYLGKTYRGYFNIGFKAVNLNIIAFNYSDSPTELISKFDISVSQVALDHNKLFYFGETTKQDIAESKFELVDFDRTYHERYNFYLSNNLDQKYAEQYAIKNLKDRVKKYTNKGFEPGATVIDAYLKI